MPPIEDRIEDLFGQGNQFGDARRFAEAEAAYQSILKLKANSGRAVYGLGNIFSDQQRWEEAEQPTAMLHSGARRMWSAGCIECGPGAARTGAGNAKRFAEAETLPGGQCN